jgi:uncharacterized damage-inducible protein DinB
MIKEHLLRELRESERFFLNTVSCLSEEDSLFRPKDESFNVAGQVAHAALSIRWFIEGAFEREDGFDMDFAAHQIEVSKHQSFTESIALLKYEFDYAKGVIATKSEDDLTATLPKGEVMSEQPRWSAILGVLEHTAHHRGALAVYARLLGKVPSIPYMDAS